MFGLSELALLLVVVIVVIGAKRLPDLARSAGKAARILKSEARAMKADGAVRVVDGPGHKVIRVVPEGGTGGPRGSDARRS